MFPLWVHFEANTHCRLKIEFIQIKINISICQSLFKLVLWIMWFIQSVCFSFDYGWKSFLVILNNNCIVDGGNRTLGRWMVTLELQQDFGSRLKMKKKIFWAVHELRHTTGGGFSLWVQSASICESGFCLELETRNKLSYNLPSNLETNSNIEYFLNRDCHLKYSPKFDSQG